MDLMVIMGIVLVLMETYNGVYWYVMDSIGGVLNPIVQMPKTQKEFCNGLTGKC